MVTFAKLLERTITTKGGCLEFTGSKNQGGYGHIWHDNKLQVVHRVSYMLCVGEIPNGMFVLHRCDNRPCCNPEHLFLGYDADNVKDMVQKGRHRHILSKETLVDIKEGLNNKIPHKELAAKHGVTREAITWWANRGRL